MDRAAETRGLRVVATALLVLGATWAGCLGASDDVPDTPSPEEPGQPSSTPQDPLELSKLSAVQGPGSDVTIRWQVVGGAGVESWVEYGQEPGLPSPETTQVRLGEGGFNALLEDLPSGVTYYRVRASSGAEAHATPIHEIVVSPAPRIEIHAPPPGGLLNLSVVTVEFAISGGNGSERVLCQLDHQDATPCTSPWSVGPLADGGHTISVRLQPGPLDEAGVEQSFTIDTHPPELAIVAPAQDALVSQGDPEVRFSASDGATTSCSVDGGPAEPCQSPHTLSGLDDGPHTITVTAEDPAGNLATVSRSFTLDTSPPMIGILSPSPGPPAPRPGVPLAFETSDATNVTVTCALDGGPAVPCQSPHPLTGLADGEHTVQVVATDEPGHTGTASMAFSVMANLPECRGVASPWSDPGDVLETGFEQGLGAWQRCGVMPEDDNRPGRLRAWNASATHEPGEVRSGSAAAEISLDGRGDNGTVWLLRPLDVQPGQAYDATVHAWVRGPGSPANTISLVVMSLGPQRPTQERSFPGTGGEVAQNGSGQPGLREPVPGPGWHPFGFNATVEAGDDGRLWLSIGVTVVWEAEVVAHIDDLEVTLAPAG